MNSRGQSLVLFVLLIPVLFLVLFMVYEIGRMVLLKQKLDNINYLAIDYGVDKMTSDSILDDVRELIIKNKNDIDSIDIKVMDNKIYIVLDDSINKTTSLIKNMELFKVRSSYVGYMDNDKKIIERDR